MERVNKTKAIESAYRRYLMSDIYDVRDAYKHCSANKLDAWRNCVKLCEEFEGHDLKVIGANSMQFSAGFIGKILENRVFVYITKEYDRYIPISLLEEQKVV